jgi:hypothetical protein
VPIYQQTQITSALYRPERSLGRQSGKVTNIRVLICHQLLQNGYDFLLRKVLPCRCLPIRSCDNFQRPCDIEPDIRNWISSEAQKRIAYLVADNLDI